MDILFKVLFVETYGDKEHIVKCNFRTAEEMDDSSDEAVLTENSMLKIYFEAPPGYKLYIDGFDQLEEHFIHEDEKGVHIRPGRAAYTLYNPFGNKKSYPFIPGNYRLLLQTSEGDWLEASMRVKTKRITSNQHSVMIEEIKDTMHTLSNEQREKWGSYFETALAVFGPDYLDEYAVILSNKEKMINGLYEIEQNRRYTVQANPYGGQSAVSAITYDVAENRWLKTVIHAILHVVNEMRVHLHRADIMTLNGPQITDLKREVMMLHARLVSFLNVHWVRQIKRGITTARIWVNGPYTVFHKVHEEIHGKVFPQAASTSQLHQPSDVLYELWGYLKVINCLQEGLGFRIKSNKHVADKAFPDLIELEKESYTLRIFHEAAIPNRKESLSTYETMFTMGHNTPDCRIDIWTKDQFKGALIIDFKYRKKEYLWNEEALVEGRPTRVMRQLSAYSTNMKTDTSRLNGVENPLTDAQPISEVWAVYPMKYEEFDVNYEKNDYAIRFLDLSPGADHSHFESLLESSIHKVSTR